MASAPLHRCTHCRRLSRGPCENCRKTRHRGTSKNRPGDPFYNTTAWRRLRAYVLSVDPLCRLCSEGGRVTPAEVVDHIKPRIDHPELALDFDNLRPCCRSCHNSVTAIEQNRKRRGRV